MSNQHTWASIPSRNEETNLGVFVEGKEVVSFGRFEHGEAWAHPLPSLDQRGGDPMVFLR
jgi:hypothetical protein